ncbi:S8 family peptidase [Paenibacillus wulumuqiensis]|uniref:S8 family peptidase n=1 Tax=Paenibacillus wulumuqiensis TaxID=1567107 RepID=UPI0006978F4A|nr:S8 family peptidase [Paenibacillus wulumuqiensis]
MKWIKKMNTWKKKAYTIAATIPLLSALLLPSFPSHPAAESDTATQRYLVAYSGEAGKQAIHQLTHAEATMLDQLQVAAVDLTAAQKNQLARQQGITSIEPNEVYASAAQAFAPNVKAITVKPNEQASWGYGMIDAQIPFNAGYTGKGVKVAILDTGISTHPELKIAGGVSVVGYTSSYADDNGHGTFMAGVIGAQDNGKGLIGEAPDAEIYGVKILDSKGNGSTEDLAKGINWAIQNDMDIVNMSIAFPHSSPAVEKMITAADAKGILLVAAAGNKGTANAATNTIEYPAKAADKVIAVTAVDNTLQRASFSASGPEADVAAPGVSIVSTASNGKYELRDGTSVAAPFVTGMAAVLKQAYPSLTNAQLRDAIEKSSIDLGQPGKDNLYGYGMISFHHLFDHSIIPASSGFFFTGKINK